MLKHVTNIIIFIGLLLFFRNPTKVYASEKPIILPIPLNVETLGGSLKIDEATDIIVPRLQNEADIFITELIQAEFGDKYRIPINISKVDELPINRKFLLIGTLDNSLVKKYCNENFLTEKVNKLGDEGYLLLVKDQSVLIASKTNRGALYGFQSFRQLIRKENDNLVLPKIKIEDKPLLPFRGIKVYLPGKDNLPFFKRFVRDFIAKYKFNKVILELNANMRLESHPELNVGTLNFGEDLNSSRRGRPAGPHKEYQNSSHQDNADGKVLEKWEVADLVKYIERFNIEVIPELPSLTHAYYLLFGHKELAEIPESEYPDTYCPLKPEIYKIYFDILNEYIDVIHPKIIHIGHDEWRMEKDVCELCKGKDYGKLFAGDITKIHGFLSAKGIGTAIWGDHLLESVRKKYYRVWKTSTGYEYKIPGALKPEQVEKLIPKDILIFNWFWKDINNDIQVSKFGFEQVYGNLRPDIDKWNERVKIKGLLGGAPSSWAGTTELNLGKDQMYDFLGCANLLWSEHYQTPEQIAFISQELMPTIEKEMSGEIPPSSIGLSIRTLSITENYNSTLNSGIDSINTDALLIGKIRKNNLIFNLPSSEKRGAVVYSVPDNSKPKEIKNIKIKDDVSSIIFLHACTKEAFNEKAYRMIYNFDDTAELLGWYEIIYEDGFVTTVPIRYGVNILDWNVHSRIVKKVKGKTKYAQNKYAYEAPAVSVSKSSATKPITFFAYEWKNQRPGKSIKKINLKSVKYKEKHDNAVILLAVSITKKKSTKN